MQPSNSCDGSCSGADDSRALVSMASQLLSNVTQLAGVVSLQTPQAAALTHIEFLPLSEQRVLAILVFDDREVQNRVVQLERQIPPEDLRRAASGAERAVPRAARWRRCART